MNTPPPLFIDLYELTMSQVYYDRNMTRNAVFELTVRSLPDGWDYLIAAGLDRALNFLESLSFGDEELDYLATLPQFDNAFLKQLRNFQFTGDVWAPPEGTVVYEHEPLIQVIAPLPQAQIVETAMINQIAYPTLVASKAARTVDAAAGRPVIEFGGRRAHGSEAAIEASRAAYIAGFDATSSIEAGRRYGVPVTGTMAHSFVLASDSEADAFDAFVSRYPGTTLLVDTYGSESGVTNAIKTAKRFGPVPSEQSESTPATSATSRGRPASSSTPSACRTCESSPAAVSTNTKSLSWSPQTHQSTYSPAEPQSSPRPTPQPWTPPTSSSSTTASRSENCLLVSRALALANKSGDRQTTTTSAVGINNPLRQTSHC